MVGDLTQVVAHTKQVSYHWVTFTAFGVWRQSLSVCLKLALNRWSSCLTVLSAGMTDVWASDLDKDFEVVYKLLDDTNEEG